MTVPVLTGERRWSCPNCTVTAVTRGAKATETPMHPCRGLTGLNAPLVPDGMDCRVVARVREDYVGAEDVQYDGEGRPIMAISTDRPDGSNDLVVLAPCAHGDMRGWA